jgi:hypothetical protein
MKTNHVRHSLLRRTLRGLTLATGLLTAAAPLTRRAHAAPPTSAPGDTTSVALWTRFELAFEATEEPRSPLTDLEVTVDFTAPSGRTLPILGFWDGFRVYRARLQPDEPGAWTWSVRVTRGVDAALAGRRGTFTVTPSRGNNPLHRHGPLRLSADRHSFVHADGTPFFWLGDTAWNGPLKADAKSWQTYLVDRRAKGFNVVQFVTTQWRTASGNADGRPAYYGTEKITVDPIFFRWLDRRVDAINDAGLLASPVLIWAIGGATANLNPGPTLPDDQLILLARYLVARYGGHHVAWMLAGDADYRGDKAARWLKIGRAVFGDKPRHLVTMHPGGRMWVADEFRKEPWFTFNGYQSGHGVGDESWRWLVEGPPATDWKKEPAVPSVNLEPNYEAHLARATGKPFDARAIRRAAYSSLLIAPPAGVSYGAHGLWSWETEPTWPMTHPYTGTAPPWHEALRLPGATSMQHLGKLFRALRWWTLRPAQELLAEQPGAAKGAADRFILAARSETERLVIVYVPEGGDVKLDLPKLGASGDAGGGAPALVATWFDPVTGARKPAGRVAPTGPQVWKAPRPDQDWVLLLAPSGGSTAGKASPK